MVERMLTGHVIARCRERMRIHDVGAIRAVLERMWRASRAAVDADLHVFGTQRHSGREYRISMWEQKEYLIVRDTVDRKYVTVIWSEILYGQQQQQQQ